MKILHTSDWHIGKRLMGKDRLLEQEEVLNELVAICEQEEIELVLVAGDIFDTYTPSAEAENLFYKTVKKMAGDTRAVLLVSGNHDDGVRLSAASPFSETQGVYIVGNDRKPLSTFSDRPVRPVVSGKGYATFENGKGERVFVSTLPYPNEARFKEEKTDLPYVETLKKWIAEGEQGNTENLPSVFLSHLFVLGGEVSESEREIGLGGARAVPVVDLPKSDYIALGHLHKKQRMGKGNCYYSGSPLAYAFDEASIEKTVKVFDLTKDGVQNLKDIPLTKGKKLLRLAANSPEEGQALLKAYPEALVELTLHLSQPLTATDSASLAENKNLVSLLADVRTEGEIAFRSRKGFSDEELFTEFYRSQYGEEPKKELTELFLSVLAEVGEA